MDLLFLWSIVVRPISVQKHQAALLSTCFPCTSVSAAVRAAGPERHSQAAAAASPRWAAVPPAGLCSALLVTAISHCSAAFCLLSLGACFCLRGWSRINRKCDEREHSASYFLKWEPKKGDGSCLMILLTSTWTNPARKLPPMGMLIGMLLTWVCFLFFLNLFVLLRVMFYCNCEIGFTFKLFYFTVLHRTVTNQFGFLVPSV